VGVGSFTVKVLDKGIVFGLEANAKSNSLCRA